MGGFHKPCPLTHGPIVSCPLKAGYVCAYYFCVCLTKRSARQTLKKGVSIFQLVSKSMSSTILILVLSNITNMRAANTVKVGHV